MESKILSNRIQGDPAGLPIVMIHPLGADQTFWEHCWAHFGPGTMSISCDLRGSGASPDLSQPLTLETTALDIERLRQALDLPKIVITGCAVGAMAAAHYAARFPEKTAALIMSNPGFRITSEGRANLIKRAELVRSSGMTALLPQAIENAFVGYEQTEGRRRYEKAFVAQKPENYAYAALGAAEADISDDIGGISCPFLLMPGRNDRLFPIEQHTKEIVRRARNATVVEFIDGAHFIPYQQGEEFGVRVSQFLKNQVLRTNH
jgi:pimeloyl-ACP methyl ester carboxylesterase